MRTPVGIIRKAASWQLCRYRHKFHGRAIAEAVRDAVHEVREYRNSLVHERIDLALPVGLVESRRRLNTFLGKLPEKWG
jgi:hypothetical protein